MTPVVRICLGVVCLLLSTAAVAWPDTCRWTGAGASHEWSLAGNWTTCHGGSIPQAGDSLVFPDGAQRTLNTNDIPGLSVTSLTIAGSGASNTAYVLSGQRLTVTNAITFDTSTVALGPRIELSLSFTGPLLLRNNGTQLATIRGSVTLGGRLTVATIDGNVSLGGSILGVGGITKSGSFNLFMGGEGSSVYDGITAINGGTVSIRDVNALGSRAAPDDYTLVSAGATLMLEQSTATMEPLIVDGGTLRLNGATGTLGGPIEVTSPTASIVVPGASVLTLSGTISGDGRFQKSGAGTVIFSGPGGHAGTSVTEGRLLVSGASGTVPFTVAGGWLGGTGQTGDVSATAGLIRPGPNPGPGLLTTGSLSLSSGSIVALDLNGPSPGAGYDQLNVIGTVALNDAPVAVSPGFNPPPGTSFIVINNDGTDAVVGTFGAGLTEGSRFVSGTTTFEVTYRGGDGNDVVFTVPPTVYTRYFAEGASNSFFATRIAVVNPHAEAAMVTLRLLGQNGVQTSVGRLVEGTRRTTFDLGPGAPLPDAVFSTIVESDRPVVADRLITWDATGYGSTLETSIAAPGTTWYLAEGATGAYSLYYLIQNPGAADASVTVTYLRPAPHAPIVRDYTVAAHSRHTIDVAGEDPGLAAAEVSARITSTQPVVVERAMYASLPGEFQAAGHDGAALPAAETRWFLAEGATGFFDEYVLIANPEPGAATIRATFLPEGLPSFSETFQVAGNSRYTLDVKRHAILRAIPVSVIVESTNAVPVVVERVMWWPSGQPWYEASLSAGVTTTGTRWAIAEGEQGGPFNSATYVLIANTDPLTDGTATVTLLYEDGTTDVSAPVPLPASRRTTIDMGTFASAANRRFGIIVESNGVPIVVERSFFSHAGGRLMAAGATSVATNLTP